MLHIFSALRRSPFVFKRSDHILKSCSNIMVILLKDAAEDAASLMDREIGEGIVLLWAGLLYRLSAC